MNPIEYILGLVFESKWFKRWHEKNNLVEQILGNSNNPPQEPQKPQESPRQEPEPAPAPAPEPVSDTCEVKGGVASAYLGTYYPSSPTTVATGSIKVSVHAAYSDTAVTDVTMESEVKIDPYRDRYPGAEYTTAVSVVEPAEIDRLIHALSINGTDGVSKATEIAARLVTQFRPYQEDAPSKFMRWLVSNGIKFNS